MRCLPVVIGTQLRNERVRLPEWLDYYEAMGASGVIIADDASTDGSARVVEARSGEKFRTTVIPAGEKGDAVRYAGSADTEKYRGSEAFAVRVGQSFRSILRVTREQYPEGAILALFDVDEFLFPVEGAQPLAVLEWYAAAGTHAAVAVRSLEVSCSTFSVPGEGVARVTEAKARMMTPDTQLVSTRAGICKSVLFTWHVAPFFEAPREEYGTHVHRAGLPGGVGLLEDQRLGLAHYRRPMYDKEANDRLCIGNAERVRAVLKSRRVVEAGEVKP